MRLVVHEALILALLSASFLASGHVSAQEPAPVEEAPATGAEAPAALPELADIIPLFTELTVQLAVFQNEMEDRPDASSAEEKYEEVQASLDELVDEFRQLKDSENANRSRLLELRESIRDEIDALEEIKEPIEEAVRRLGKAREEWLAEKAQWSEWQKVLIEERGLVQLSETFDKANATIDAALRLVIPQLEEMLRIQERGGNIESRLKTLAVELDTFLGQGRRGALVEENPPLLSYAFVAQLTAINLWNALANGLEELPWPGRRLIDQHAWIILLQVFISVFTIAAILRNRARLEESTRWRFLSRRTYAAGLFLGYMATALIYESQGAPVLWKQANSILGGVTFARILGGLIESAWKRHIVYGLMILLIGTRIIETLNLPLPLFRLYVVAISAVGLLFCLRWAGECRRGEEPGYYFWGLRLATLFLGVIVIAELLGKAPLSFFLLISMMRSVAIVLVFMLLMYMIRGGLEWLFYSSPVKKASSLYSDTDALVKRMGRFVDIAIWGLVVVPSILLVWGVFDDLDGATRGLLGVGFNLGAHRISVGLLIAAAGFIYFSFLLSWVLQHLVVDKVLLRRGAERGVRVSAQRLVHYILISIGFIFALSVLGFELTKLTIMLSALGVGIGFGLQSIVNNFLSGLILLFERPVRVGDYIELGGNWCEIQKIGLRSTVVQTFDQANVIIPNGDLITNQVTNWTLKNRRARLILPVGVAYGSDIPLVIETLKASAEPHPMVAKSPTPQVLFVSFGDSSLDLELRVWILDVDNMLSTKSEIYQEIDRRFREANIEIPFPQRDLHFRSSGEPPIPEASDSDDLS